MTHEEKTMEVKVEPGMMPGNTIVFSGMCSDHPQFTEAGDVTVILREAEEENNYTAPAIRIAGDFTARHLPWYKKFLSELSGEELYVYMKHNKSSTFVRSCLNPMLKQAGETLKRDTIKQVMKDINSG
jgi:hypothetical protein